MIEDYLNFNQHMQRSMQEPPDWVHLERQAFEGRQAQEKLDKLRDDCEHVFEDGMCQDCGEVDTTRLEDDLEWKTMLDIDDELGK